MEKRHAIKIEHNSFIGPVTTDKKGNISITGVINSKIMIVRNDIPLKRLVGFAAYDGNGYSKDESDIKKR